MDFSFIFHAILWKIFVKSQQSTESKIKTRTLIMILIFVSSMFPSNSNSHQISTEIQPKEREREGFDLTQTIRFQSTRWSRASGILDAKGHGRGFSCFLPPSGRAKNITMYFWLFQILSLNYAKINNNNINNDNSNLLICSSNHVH